MTDDEFKRVLHALMTAPLWSRRKYLRRAGYPRFLYKYRSFDHEDVSSVSRLRDVAIDSKLWLSSPLDFNDPFDMSTRIVVDGSPLKRRARISQLVRSVTNLQTRELRREKVREVSTWSPAKIRSQWAAGYERQKREIGVYSLAGNARSILMWSHYASNHQGLCLQFDIARDPETFLHAISVEYSSEYPVINWVDDTAKQITIAIKRKHCGWRYEGERRIVRPRCARTYLPFRSSAFVGVVFGCNCSPQVRSAVVDILDERATSGSPMVTTYLATKHESDYKIVLRRGR